MTPNTDEKLKEAVKALAAIKKLKRGIMTDVKNHVKSNYPDKQSEEILTGLFDFVELASEQYKEVSSHILVKNFLVPYLWADYFVDKPDRTRLLQQLHERRSQLVRVGIDVGIKPAGFMKRGTFICLKPTEQRYTNATTIVFNHIRNVAASHVKPITNDFQHVLLFGYGNTKVNNSYSVPANDWRYSLSKIAGTQLRFNLLLSEHIDQTQSIPDLLLVHSCNGWGLEDPIKKISSWVKTRASTAVFNVAHDKDIQMHTYYVSHDDAGAISLYHNNRNIPTGLTMPGVSSVK